MTPPILQLLGWLATWLLVLATLPGTLYLLVLSLAGMRAPARPVAHAGDPDGESVKRPRVAIVIPAHNEATGIARTLANLCDIAARDGDASVVVVADNCTDETAAVARALGARVLERHDDSRRGKGYALDFAFRVLGDEGIDTYVVIDADSMADADLLEVIRDHLSAGAEAIQVRYTVLNPQSSPRARLAELALCAFNCLRPRGRHALGLSAGILGNGFALRQSVLDRVPYTATSVVEDLEYHLKLMEQGIRVHFADETTVRGEMPAGGSGQRTQRARWEGGRLRMLLDHGGALAGRVIGGEVRFLEPLLDLMLLPLAYHTLLLLGLMLVPSIWAKALGVVGLLVLAGHVLAAARVGGLSPSTLLDALIQAPRYLLWKLANLQSTVRASKTSTRWVRTDRQTPSQKA